MRKILIPLILASVLIFEVGFWIGKYGEPYRRAQVAGLQIEATNTISHHASLMATDTYDQYFVADTITSVVTSTVVSAVVPHHLLAGRYEADFFKQLGSQHPSVVVLIGPNHAQAGRNNIVTGLQNWRTPYGEVVTNQALVQNLIGNSAADLNDDLIGDEHSIGAVVPFIRHAWPNTTIIPIIVKDRTTHSEIDKLLSTLQGSLPPDSLVLASEDFSHYLPLPVADFHDELSINVLATGDTSRLRKLEIDSEPTLYFLLAYNRLRQSQQFHLVYHTNSAAILGQPDLAETTSHIMGYFTAGAPTEQPLIALQFFGDIMLDRNVARLMGTSGLDYVLKNIRGQENRFFSGADLFIANLEGPFAPTRIPTSKSIAFRFDPKWAVQLKKYNFGVVSLANNHSVDMGWANVKFTENVLATSGVHYFGREYYEGSEFNWVTTMVQGNAPALPLPESVAFVAFETVDHKIDKQKVLNSIADARQKARYVIAVVHGGTEYRRTSTTDQQALYHWLIDNDVTAVIAHHPHVVEETEIYHGSPIFYSLGNFIFDQYFSKDTQEGLSVGLTLQDGKVKDIYFFPIQSVRSQDSLMRGQTRTDFWGWMVKNSRLGSSTIQDGKISL